MSNVSTSTRLRLHRRASVSIESGNHPTEASTWAAEQANKVDGGVETLRNSVNALASNGLDSSNTGADAGGHPRAGPQGTASTLHLASDSSGGRAANGQAENGAIDGDDGVASVVGERDRVDEQSEVGEGNQKEDGDEDDGYDEEVYEDEFDEDEDGDAENERTNQSDTGIGEKAHRESNGQEEDIARGGGSVNDDNRRIDGDKIGGTGDQQAGAAGVSGGNTHEADNATQSDHALGPYNISEIPVYLCGGGEVRMP